MIMHVLNECGVVAGPPCLLTDIDMPQLVSCLNNCQFYIGIVDIRNKKEEEEKWKEIWLWTWKKNVQYKYMEILWVFVSFFNGGINTNTVNVIHISTNRTRRRRLNGARESLHKIPLNQPLKMPSIFFFFLAASLYSQGDCWNWEEIGREKKRDRYKYWQGLYYKIFKDYTCMKLWELISVLFLLLI